MSDDGSDSPLWAVIAGKGGNTVFGVFADAYSAEQSRLSLIEEYIAGGRERAWAEDWVEVVPYPPRRRPATPDDFARTRDMAADLRNPIAMAHAWGREPTPAEFADYLLDSLGPRLTAIIAGTTHTADVKAWADGSEVPADAAQRLRDATEVVAFLRPHDSPSTIAAWLQGLNPHLGDRSAAMMLRNGDVEEVLSAARHWIANA